MAKFLDKTLDEWDNIVKQWHNDDSVDIPLAEYMEVNCPSSKAKWISVK